MSLRATLLIIGLFLTSLLCAGEKYVSLTTLDEYPPLCFAKPTGENKPREIITPGNDSKYLQGYAWDVVREAFQTRQYTIILTVLPWNRAETAAKLSGANRALAERPANEKSSIVVNFGFQGVNLLSSQEEAKIDNSYYRADLLFPTVKTSEREKIFAFSPTPIDRINTTLYVLNSSGFKLNGLESLKGKRIGIMKGWNYGSFLSELNQVPEVRKLEFIDMETGFRLLRNRRIDILAGYSITFDRELRRIRWENAFTKYRSQNYLEEFVCGVRNNSRTEELLREFELGLQTLRDNGTLTRLQKKWQLPNDVAAAGK